MCVSAWDTIIVDCWVICHCASCVLLSHRCGMAGMCARCWDFHHPGGDLCDDITDWTMFPAATSLSAVGDTATFPASTSCGAYRVCVREADGTRSMDVDANDGFCDVVDIGEILAPHAVSPCSSTLLFPVVVFAQCGNSGSWYSLCCSIEVFDWGGAFCFVISVLGCFLLCQWKRME